MFHKHLTTGLDLGQHSVKFSLVENEIGNVLEIYEAPILPARQSREESLAGEDLKQRLTSLVKTVQKERPSFLRGVNTAIQGEGTLCRYLELPPLSPKEMEVAVPSQAMKFIPFPKGEMKISYFQVPPLSPGEKKNTIFFVAAQQSAVQELAQLLEGCGLEVQRVEIPILALVREYARNYEMPPDQFVALVNVGFRLTEIVVLREGYPYFAREFLLAGRDFTYAFQMSGQSSWEEAERHKLSYDTVLRDVAIEPALTRWMDEVKKTIVSFSGSFPGQAIAVQQVVLSGGTANWKNLSQRLSEHLELPVLASSWNRVKPREKTPDADKSCTYKVAVGLALTA